MHTSRMDKRKAALIRKKKEKRIIMLGTWFTFLLALLTLRLFYIQILEGEEHANRVRHQHIDQIVLDEKSGNITDRNGISFTSAGEIWKLKIIPHTIAFNEKAFEVIKALTGKDKTEFNCDSMEIFNVPVINPDKDLLAAVAANQFNGVLCYKENIRYNDDSLARHVIGYLRKSDNVPMSGIEKVFSSYLHPGLESYVNVFSDAANRPIFSLGYQINEPERKWYDVQLTLDYNIQKTVEQVLDKYPGHRHGGIVIDAATGGILALASRPQYQQHNPIAMQTDGMDSSFLAIPLEQYPLGSVFKIIVASAALESGYYNGNTTFTCSGGIQMGNRWMPCHASTGGLGTITLREAFAHSCNDTFIRIAQEIGGETIISTAKRFGLGRSIDIGLPNAAGRLMEEDEYIGSGIANLAIGQGSILVTPLQVADMIATILNGGIRKPIELVDGLVDPEGNFTKYDFKQEESVTGHRVISQQTASALMDWMGDVTEYGTAKNMRDSIVGGTAGKTGTPQVSGDLKSSNYGWFAGFFPRDNPIYIIVVLSLEEGGAVETAVPIFQDIARDIWLNIKS